MSGPPRLPFHTGDYLKDTPPISRVSWEHHGIYFLALLTSWNTPRCQLPNDPEWLAMRFGCTVDEYHEHVDPVLRIYFSCDGKFFRQKRLRQEAGYVRKQSKLQSHRAKARKTNNKTPSRNCNPAQPELQSGSAPIPIPTPTPKLKESDSVESTAQQAGEQAFEEWWKLYPKKTGKKKVAVKFAGILRRREATAEELTDGLTRHREMWRIEGTPNQYIPNPETWLNQGRWEDDLGPPDAGGTEPAINGHRSFADDELAKWIDRVVGYRTSGFWLDTWGFKPGDPDCQIPKEALDAGLPTDPGS